MPHIEIIENTNHLIELHRDFDRKHNTKSFFANLTLQEIWDHFLGKSDKDIIWYANNAKEFSHQIIKFKQDDLFKNGSISYSDDSWVDESMIGKIHSMYLMKREILSGQKLRDPMCISVFNNGNCPVHPGGTRMNWTSLYHHTLPVIVTEYDVPSNLDKLSPIEEIDFDFNGKNFSFMIGNSITDSGWASYRKAANGDDITYRQVQNIQQDYIPFLHPQQMQTRIKFERKDDKLFIDDYLLAEKIDGLWGITLREEYA